METLKTIGKVALCLEMQTKYDAAELLYRDALERLGKPVGLKIRETNYVMENLASMFGRQGRTKEAAEVRKRFGAPNHEVGTSSAPRASHSLLSSRQVSVASSSGRNEVEVDKVDNGGGPVSDQGRHTTIVSATDPEDYDDCSSNDQPNDFSESYMDGDMEGTEAECSRPRMSLKGNEICYD